MDNHSLVAGLLAAGVVGLWGSPHLISVLLSEPPPTRRRAIREALNSVASMVLAGAMGVMTLDWGAAFINAVVLKYAGVNPSIDPRVAGVVVAVLVTQLGPAMLTRVEKLLGKKTDEVAS